MIVLLGNDARLATIVLARKYPGKLGWLISTTCYKNPRQFVPFAVDNGAFSAYKNAMPWNESVWLNMLDKIVRTGLNPLWILVPDVVANRIGTLKLWEKHSIKAKEYGWPLAFAVQDGMIPSDVPEDADVIFVGGTTRWKLRNLPMWCGHFSRIHVGRVNTLMRLHACERLGVESCDGTGWFRKTINGKYAQQLIGWLETGNRQIEFRI